MARPPKRPVLKVARGKGGRALMVPGRQLGPGRAWPGVVPSSNALAPVVQVVLTGLAA
jgi:hypothetical protein